MPASLRKALVRTTADTWIGVLMLIAAVVYWFEANKIHISPLDGPVGASGLPKSLAYVLAGLSTVLIFKGISATRNKALHDVMEPIEVRSFSEWIKPHLRAIGMLAIGVGYLLLLPLFGYTVTIGMLLLAVSLYNGAGFTVRTMLVAVLGAVFCQLLFVYFLGIPLPGGELMDRILER